MVKLTAQELTDEDIRLLKDRVRGRGFFPSIEVVRAVLECAEEMVPEEDRYNQTDAAVDIIRAQHPKSVVRRRMRDGSEVDTELCEWCGVPYADCPTVRAARGVMEVLGG